MEYATTTSLLLNVDETILFIWIILVFLFILLLILYILVPIKMKKDI